MASTAAARRPSFEKKRSTSNVNLTSNRSSSTVNLAANDDDTHTSAQHRPHKTKQFVVHAGRHHTRVPSYGRNLNKLSKLSLAHEGGTTSKGHHLERGGSNGRKSIKGEAADGAVEERRPNTSKKPAFEIGDSDEDTANEEEEVVVKHSPVKRTNGLKKSSSTKSLERQTGARREERPERPHRERSDRSIRSERSDRSERSERPERPEKPEKVDSDRSERSDPRERENVTIQLRRPPQHQPQPQPQPQPEPMASSVRTLVNNDHERRSEISGATIVDNLRSRPPPFSQVVNPAAAPPQINPEYATRLHTPTSSGGGSTTYSNNQALTSRFIDSPGRSGASTSVSPQYTRAVPPEPQSNGHATRPSSSKSLPLQQSPPPPAQKSSLSGAGSSTTSIPSRTQQKLWLQRQFDEDAQQVSAKKMSQNGNMGLHSNISQRELERTTREFYNVRRFKDPIGDALERIRDHPKLQRRIPRKSIVGDERERGMGLSQSLNANIGKGGKSTGQDKGLKGSRDDSGIKGGNDMDDEGNGSGTDPNVEALLKQLWNKPQLLTSNE